LLADCFNEMGGPVPSVMIDPSQPRNFAFLRDFFAEVLETFPDHWVHLGGVFTLNHICIMYV
jgi:hypothetical protein